MPKRDIEQLMERVIPDIKVYGKIPEDILGQVVRRNASALGYNHEERLEAVEKVKKRLRIVDTKVVHYYSV